MSNIAIDAALGFAHIAGHAWLALTPPRGTVQCIRNIRYGPRPRQRLDHYRPSVPRPLHLWLVHGGSFRVCSKESHQFPARTPAALGVQVYVIDYGLAPHYPYPVAHRDAMFAYRWLAQGPAQG